MLILIRRGEADGKYEGREVGQEEEAKEGKSRRSEAPDSFHTLEWQRRRRRGQKTINEKIKRTMNEKETREEKKRTKQRQ